MDETDLNLLYVAVTRAKKTLILPDELFLALEENLAFTLNKHKPAPCLLDNLLPKSMKSPGAKTSSKPQIKNAPSNLNKEVKSSHQPKPSSLASSALSPQEQTPQKSATSKVSAKQENLGIQKAPEEEKAKKAEIHTLP
ncbi:hypothetical protein VMF7928_04502 [Vibrio marisflavi CECT 7928]|uniref:DNA helicase n=2 Tax=Vibrio marisflavi TaxID=1216040 RepID=A0ABM9A9N8_9VIBR|nr:hypothetical protein VMF7928_04502 [Vibrio marisflavi CECT 7928]